MANFLFVLSKDDNETATRCFQFAKIAYTKGHHVDLFFIDGGVMWAKNEGILRLKQLRAIVPRIISHIWSKMRSKPEFVNRTPKIAVWMRPDFSRICS